MSREVVSCAVHLRAMGAGEWLKTIRIATPCSLHVSRKCGAVVPDLPSAQVISVLKI